MSLAALIFDVDGTLAQTEELHRAAFNEAFAAAELDWHWGAARYAELLAITGGKERMAHHQAQAGTMPQLDAAGIARLHADKTARYVARIEAGGLALRPGVRRLLAEASGARLRLAIATTTTRANVEALLRAAAPLPAFDVIAAGDEVAAKKPAPDIYTLALHRLGLPAAQCIAIEDTANGVASAVAAGLRCVVTTSAYGGAGPFPDAAAVVTQLGEAEAPAAVLSGAALPCGVVDLAWLHALP